MSTLQYRLYKAGIRRLTDTLLIKHNDEVTRVNQSLMSLGYEVGDEPTSWKYYLNVSGQYHYTDTLMHIVSLDTAQRITFTRANLLTHRNTLKAYTLGSSYYKELVRQYPQQTALIRGIIKPVDIEVAIAADNYTILRYDSQYVEANETKLIPRLEQRIKQWANRWYNGDYALIENLYLPSFMGILYAHIPNLIESIRLDHCKTYQVHSFHLWNYLDGFGALSQYKEHLTIEQALWLYRNIQWIRANAGKQVVHRVLMDKLLTARGIPLAAYTVVQNVANITETLSPTVELRKYPLNQVGTITGEAQNVSVDYIFDKQLLKGINNDQYIESSTTTLIDKVKAGHLSEYPTKVYESDIIDQSERLTIRLSDVLINQWAHLAQTKAYTSLVNVRNPDTGDILALRPNEAFVLWIYATNQSYGISLDEVPNITASMLPVYPIPTVEDLRDYAGSDITDEELEALVDASVELPTTLSSDSLYSYADALHTQMLAHRQIATTVSDLKAYQQLKGCVSLFYYDRDISFVDTPTTYSQYMDTRGWELGGLDRDDWQTLAASIQVAAVGVDNSDDNGIVELQKALLRLMAQLGTYDTHYIQTVNSEPTLVLDALVIRNHTRSIVRKSKDRHFTKVQLNDVTMVSRGRMQAKSQSRLLDVQQTQQMHCNHEVGNVADTTTFKEKRFALINPNFTINIDGVIPLDTYYQNDVFMQYLLNEATVLR